MLFFLSPKKRIEAGEKIKFRFSLIRPRFRRFPCNVTRPTMLDFFVDQSVDPEVRIAAYLQVMRCPIYSVVRHIVNVLDGEGVNQGKRRRANAEGRPVALLIVSVFDLFQSGRSSGRICKTWKRRPYRISWSCRPCCPATYTRSSTPTYGSFPGTINIRFF